jgi:hypothetical protein
VWPDVQVNLFPDIPRVDRQTKRSLTDFEKNEARLVFGASLKLDMISVDEVPFGDSAITPYTTIYFPPGSFGESNFMPWLIHELTHAWQTQHGVSVGEKVWYAFRAKYDYGGEKAPGS